MSAPFFTALIPARLASTRLPDKALAMIGQYPMVVHVAQRAKASMAKRVVVATDSQSIVDACDAHGIESVMTRADHVSGSDRLAEACQILGLDDGSTVVNVQGDEPMMDPTLIDAVAGLLHADATAVMSTAAHAIETAAEFLNPNVVKVVLDAHGRAIYFSRAPIPFARAGDDGWLAGGSPDALRHIGIYGYRVGFLKEFPRLTPAPLEHMEALEQLRVIWHGHKIAVHLSAHAPGPGVDTPEDLERVRSLMQTF